MSWYKGRCENYLYLSNKNKTGSINQIVSNEFLCQLIILCFVQNFISLNINVTIKQNKYPGYTRVETNNKVRETETSHLIFYYLIIENKNHEVCVATVFFFEFRLFFQELFFST